MRFFENFVKKSKKSPKKQNCSKFLEKNKNCIFFQNFLRECLLASSKGTRNNQKKILSSFWDISKNRIFLSKKWKNHQKIQIVRNFLEKIKFVFFLKILSKNVFFSLLRGRETTRKKYRVVFEIYLKYHLFFDRTDPSVRPSVRLSVRPSI